MSVSSTSSLRAWLAEMLPRAPRPADAEGPEIPPGGLFVRGLAMGAAEVVPGVSGGTVAFVTGIYDELVRSLASFSHRSPLRLGRQGWRSFAREHNVAFFLALGGGMVASFLIVANVLATLLTTHGVYVFGLFFGLIAGSIFHVAAQSSWRWLCSLGVAGLAAGLALELVSKSGPADDVSALGIFGAGALAATAWILPGVSGSFMLLLLGLYRPLLEALQQLDLATLGIFAGGLAAGLLGVSKLLRWLLERVREPLAAVLTGFVAGSLLQIWPWRAAPAEDAWLAGVVFAMLAGVLIVLPLGRRARRGAGPGVG